MDRETMTERERLLVIRSKVYTSFRTTYLSVDSLSSSLIRKSFFHSNGLLRLQLCTPSFCQESRPNTHLTKEKALNMDCNHKISITFVILILQYEAKIEYSHQIESPRSIEFFFETEMSHLCKKRVGQERKNVCSEHVVGTAMFNLTF